MKFIFLIFIISMTGNLYAVELKTGLWKTNNEIKINGKELDIQKKIDQAMGMIPEAQRPQFLKIIKKQMGGGGLISGLVGKTLCITKEMTKDPLAFLNKQKDCKSIATKNEEKLKVYKIKCDNGANGLLTWNIVSAKSYNGHFDGQSEKKEKVIINFRGDYSTSKCD